MLIVDLLSRPVRNRNEPGSKHEWIPFKPKWLLSNGCEGTRPSEVPRGRRVEKMAKPCARGCAKDVRRIARGANGSRRRVASTEVTPPSSSHAVNDMRGKRSSSYPIVDTTNTSTRPRKIQYTKASSSSSKTDACNEGECTIAGQPRSLVGGTRNYRVRNAKHKASLACVVRLIPLSLFHAWKQRLI